MALTVLEPEGLYPDSSVEDAIWQGAARVLRGNAVNDMSSLSDAMLAQADAIMTLRCSVRAEDIARAPNLKLVVRMGVGYDRVDREACAARGVIVCNTPDYGTMEVGEFAVLLAMSLRRGLTLYHDTQRGDTPAPWAFIRHPVVRRQEVQTFALLGCGRIGTAAGLRAKALGYRVVFFDPLQPNGWERGLGFARVRTLDALLEQADVLSIHTPLTRATRGLIGERELRLMPKNAVVVNTARGPILDIDALARVMQDGHIAGAGLDVIPVEPPVEPVPELLRAYRDRAPWTLGRLIITPHIAFHSPEAWDDIRRLSVETVRDVLLEGKQTNVIPPQSE
ncbi:C-terminal binding protein [Plastoroseomonas arctica]|uniref:C-terminal binding protein n=1 Tax=Plastoroseomonas arctica TaxID=1509237 RepID=A0AAF1JZ02_9PROT|nr:C-terminal binding protein [Plastoroseomonas arctica]MBR0656305.1 C-terminal binding protein [Plastoroseomonas arctica]